MVIRMITRAGRSAALSAACLFLVSGWCAAASFTADYTTTMRKSVTNGKIYVKDNKVRRETITDGKTWVTIVRGDKGVTWMLNPDKKTYREVRRAVLHTPSEESLAKIADKKDDGTEKINGYECKKVVWTMRDEAGGAVTIWNAVKLDWPIQSVVTSGAGTITTVVKNIVEKAPKDSLFELPADYTKEDADNTGPPKQNKDK